MSLKTFFVNFETVALAVHIGKTVKGGHYWAAVKHPDGCWLKMNDSAISRLNQSEYETIERNCTGVLLRRVRPVVPG